MAMQVKGEESGDGEQRNCEDRNVTPYCVMEQ